MLLEKVEKLERYLINRYRAPQEQSQILFGIDRALSNNGYFKFLTSWDLRNYNNKLDWKEIKYSSTNSPIKTL